MLHTLIDSKRILRFRRSAGWVTVGVDPLRQFQRTPRQIPVDEVKNIIRVAYDDNHFDYITDKTLDNLLELKKVIKFKRVTGWVTVGVDPLRKAKREHTFRFPSELKKRA
jgi:hypothetical protein